LFARPTPVAIAFLLFTSSLFSSCGSLSYLLQASEGQWELFNRAKPIAEVLKDERTPPRIKNLLSQIPAVKKFGESQGLKPTPNYKDYVKLDRSAAVYVVSASEVLRFKSKTWSFPIVGSFPYLGWFDLKNAQEYAESLRKEGWDADVRGASAYSTLGWFRDAVLSTMIPDAPTGPQAVGDPALGELVNVVIHESVHATLYINGQSYFNESLASFVADHLTRVYLDQKVGANSPEKAAYVQGVTASEVALRKLHLGYEELEKLYQSSKPDTEKLELKAKILAKLKADLGYRRDLNNATLIQFKTYNTGQTEFDALIKACQGDWHYFMSSLATLKDSSFANPQQEDFGPVVMKLAENGCPR